MFFKLCLIVLLNTVAILNAITISGTVSNEDGETLPGANILLKGTNVGTMSDEEGDFTLNVSDDDYNQSSGLLIITYIGYTRYKVNIAKDVNIYNVVLTKDALGLSEVLVTGRGTASREALGIKVATISTNEIINSGESNIISSLSGKETGLEITSTSGEPGSSTYIRIRGANTIQSGQQPLIVVDGSPIDNSAFGNSLGRYGPGEGATATNRAMDLNPNDIKSVEILKGPAAASIYGTKAKNGVILINTKSGTIGKPRATYRYTVSSDEATQQPNLNTRFGMGISGTAMSDFALSWGPLLSNLSATDSVGGVPVTADVLSAYYRNGKIYDHTLDIFTNGGKEEHSITVSGGEGSTSYYLNFSNMNHTGFFVGPNNFYNRQSIRLKGSQKVNEQLSVLGNMLYTRTEGSFIQMGSNISGLLLGSYRTPPNFDNTVYLDPSSGYHRSYRNSSPDGLYEPHGYDNPHFLLNEQRNLTGVNRFIGSIETQYKINNALNFLYRYGTDFTSDNRRYVFPPSSSENPAGIVDVQLLSTKLVDHVFQLSSSKDFGGLNTNFTIGQNLNGRDYLRVGVVGEKMAVYNFQQLDNTTDQTPDEYSEQIRTSSTYLNLTLGMNSAFVTVGMNRDGSSTFGTDNRFSNFPRSSFSWTFSDMLDLPFVNKGLLRVAWGKAGSEPGAYLTKDLFISNTFSDGWGPELTAKYGGFGGFVTSSTKSNADIRPEVVTELEYGVDLALLKNRLKLGLTLYTQNTEDAILQFPVSPSTGYSYELKNAATLENKGFEASIDFDVIETPDHLFSTKFNYSKNKNIVTSLAGSENVMVGGFYAAAGYAVEGEPFGVIRGGDWLKTTSGVDSLDVNGFPMENPAVSIIGDPNPDWLGNLRFSYNYKSTLRVSALLDIKEGGDMWNGTKGALYFFGAHGETAKLTTVPYTITTDDDGNEIMETGIKTWGGGDLGVSPDIINNDDGTLSFRGYLKDFGGGMVAINQDAYLDGPFSGFTGPASQFVEDAGYVKLREIAISYLYSGHLTKQLGVTSLDFSLTLRNLKTWTEYSGIDPESNLVGTANVRGLDYFGNPQTRSILFNLIVNL